MSKWKGWAINGVALYLEQPVGAEHVGLFMQRENVVVQVATFHSEDAALEVEMWLDTSVSVVGVANAELTRMLTARRG